MYRFIGEIKGSTERVFLFPYEYYYRYNATESPLEIFRTEDSIKAVSIKGKGKFDDVREACIVLNKMFKPNDIDYSLIEIIYAECLDMSGQIKVRELSIELLAAYDINTWEDSKQLRIACQNYLKANPDGDPEKRQIAMSIIEYRDYFRLQRCNLK
jgi:hypothetical protein